MATFTIPNVFVANTVIKSADMNANFAAIAALLNSSLLPPIGGTPGDIVSIDMSGNFTSIPAPAVQGDLLSFSTVPDVLPVGTAGQVLTVNLSQPTGLQWSTPSSPQATNDPNQLLNLGFAYSVTAGALTISVKQADGVSDPTLSNPVIIAVKNAVSSSAVGYTLMSITAPLSYTLPAGTILNSKIATQFNLWIYLVNNDGVADLAVSTIDHGGQTLTSTVLAQQTCTITIASPAVITTSSPHNFANKDCVQFTSTGALPTGLSTATPYYVTVIDSLNFSLMQYPETLPVNTSGTQSGTQTVVIASARLVSSQVYLNNSVRLLSQAKVTLVSPGTWVLPTSTQLSNSNISDEVFAAIYQNAVIFTQATPFTFTFSNTIIDTHDFSKMTPSNSGVIVVPRNGIYEISGFMANIIIQDIASEPLLLINASDGSAYLAAGQSIVNASGGATLVTSFYFDAVIPLQANSSINVQLVNGAGNYTSDGIGNHNILNILYRGDLP